MVFPVSPGLELTDVDNRCTAAAHKPHTGKGDNGNEQAY